MGLPVIVLLLALYGPAAVLDPTGADGVPWIFAFLLVLLPMFGWAGVVWFGALAEAHRFSVGRAVLTTFLLLAVIVALALVVVFALR
jgi:hypothetical protein